VTGVLQQVTLPITIVVRPSSINLDGGGHLDVTVSSTASFNAGDIDVSDLSRIRFGDVNLSGRVAAFRARMEGTSGERRPDLALRFDLPLIRAARALDSNSRSIEVTGFLTTGGRPVRGVAAVTIHHEGEEGHGH